MYDLPHDKVTFCYKPSRGNAVLLILSIKVIQRRVNGSVNFYRDWNSYKDGFGSPDHELWLGNDKIYHLTNQNNYQLRVDVVHRDGSPLYAKYDLFRLSDEHDNYTLTEVGTYSGNLSDGMFQLFFQNNTTNSR